MKEPTLLGLTEYEWGNFAIFMIVLCAIFGVLGAVFLSPMLLGISVGIGVDILLLAFYWIIRLAFFPEQ